MADRLKPEHAEIVDRIRELEREIAIKQNFKKYHNYYAPEDIVKFLIQLHGQGYT